MNTPTFYTGAPEALEVSARTMEEKSAREVSVVLSVGGSAETDARLDLHYDSVSGKHALSHRGGSIFWESAAPSVKPAPGDSVEIRAVLCGEAS
jgi:hypothetical protein